MDNALGVCGAEGIGNLPGKLEHSQERELASAQSVGQALSLQQFHYKIAGAIGEPTEVGDLHKTWMFDEVYCARFVEEAICILGVASKL
jgi:hypothetical protein